MGRPRQLQDPAQSLIALLRNAQVLQGCYAHVPSRCWPFSARLLPFYPDSVYKQIIGIRTGSPLPSGWEKLFQLLVYFLVEDYTNYCIHRFLHSKLGYEKIHRVHHKYTAPFGFAAPYAPGHMVTFWLWSRLGPLKTRSGKLKNRMVAFQYLLVVRLFCILCTEV
ncbi:unnamed protein product [Prunus armeniaca]|uniref:Fatty acid hydroxylase domain-containing protein n=1 Tax=Prunus armeniaca TaxID=36596 RepID=A0A6J5UUT6_PRUAR|nr:unnamed protein product [Prunus armeniaca]CAB4310125.1 unnamed protein product [Prunus armeniaca]